MAWNQKDRTMIDEIGPTMVSALKAEHRFLKKAKSQNPKFYADSIGLDLHGRGQSELTIQHITYRALVKEGHRIRKEESYYKGGSTKYTDFAIFYRDSRLEDWADVGIEIKILNINADGNYIQIANLAKDYQKIIKTKYKNKYIITFGSIPNKKCFDAKVLQEQLKMKFHPGRAYHYPTKYMWHNIMKMDSEFATLVIWKVGRR